MKFTLGEKISIAVMLTVTAMVISAFLNCAGLSIINPVAWFVCILHIIPAPVGPILCKLWDGYLTACMFVFAVWCTIPMRH